MAELPWYKDGLKFQCSQCGNCCTGAPGFVWVNKQEMQDIANAIGLTDLDEFKEKYTQKVGIRYSLKELPGSYDCIFFDSKSRGCQVYDARPRQCRTWPFWDSNLKSEESWQATCQICPGSGKGPIVPLEVIEEQRTRFKL